MRISLSGDRGCYFHVHQETVGTSAVQASETGCGEYGTLLSALADNTETVWYGHSASVTETNGAPLLPGTDVYIPVAACKIYLVATAPGQKVAVVQT